MSDAVTVLVVEDNPQLLDYLTAKIGSLELVASRPTRVLEAIDLATALARVEEHDVDLVVLDLNLPDSEGVDTVVRVAAAAPAVPLVVVTGSATPDVIERIVLAGAHDCLVKGDFGGSELSRTLRVNVARHRRHLDVVNDLLLQRDLLRQTLDEQTDGSDDAGSDEDDETDASDVGDEPAGMPRSVAASASASLGRPRLVETFPAQVAEAGRAYGQLIGRRLEERGLHVDYQVSSRSRSLAWDLGRYRAAPRDVVDVHLEALRDRLEGKSPARRAALTRAAESLLIETMGHLAAYYRTQSMGSSRAHVTTDQGSRDNR